MVRVRGGGTHRQKLETPRRKQHTTREHETVTVSVEDRAPMVTEEVHQMEDVRAGVESPLPCQISELEGYRNIEHERQPLRQSSELEKRQSC